MIEFVLNKHETERCYECGKVTPKSLESEKAAEYALAVCEEGLGKSGVKTKNLGGGSFGTAVGVTFGDGSEAVVKFLRADGMLEKETHDLQLLSENCGVRMPKVLYFRSADGSIPLDCYVMDKSRAARSLCHSASCFIQKARSWLSPIK